jgi:hypothetical protein
MKQKLRLTLTPNDWLSSVLAEEDLSASRESMHRNCMQAVYPDAIHCLHSIDLNHLVVKGMTVADSSPLERKSSPSRSQDIST